MMSFWVVPVSFARGDALLVGERDVERQQPRRRRVDGHRRVHLAERDAVEQRAHVAEMARSARRPCRPRPGRADDRCRSRSGSADRRRPRGRSGPWRGSCDRARSTSRAVEWPGIGAEDPGLVARPAHAIRLLGHRTALAGPRLCNAAYSNIGRKRILWSADAASRGGVDHIRVHAPTSARPASRALDSNRVTREGALTHSRTQILELAVARGRFASEAALAVSV